MAPTTTTAAQSSSSPGGPRWLNGRFHVALAAYDVRRGRGEGAEAEKLLAFHPRGAPPAMQASLVGLAQAVTMFAGTFNKDCPAQHMETDHNSWAMVNVEHGIWLLMIVSRAWARGAGGGGSGIGGSAGAGAAPGALEAYLRTLYALCALLHGPLNAQLDDDPSAGTVRRRLQPLFDEMAARLLQRGFSGSASGGGDAAAIVCPLAPRGGAPLLRAPRPAFAALQALVTGALVAPAGPGGARAVHGVAVCFGAHLVWSTLAPDDTNALFALASRGPLAAACAGARHRTVKRPLGASAGGAGGAAADPAATPVAAHSLLNAAFWELHATGAVAPVGAGDAAAQGAAGAAAAAALPAIWLQVGAERCRLLVRRCGPLVMLAALSEAAASTAAAVAPSAANAAGGHVIGGGGSGTAAAAALAAAAASLARWMAERAPAVADALAAHVPAKDLWHVPGLRYHYLDGSAGVERLSPLIKTATLSAASLAACATAQAALDLETVALSDPTRDAPAQPQPPQHHHRHHNQQRHHQQQQHAFGGSGSAAASTASPGSSPRGGGGGTHSPPPSHHQHHQHHARRHRRAAHHHNPRRAADPAAWAAFLAGAGAAGDAELLFRAAHDCAVVARRCDAFAPPPPVAAAVPPGLRALATAGSFCGTSGGGGGGLGDVVVAGGMAGSGACGGERRITAVVEGDRERAGLPSVMGRVDALCDGVCPGVFDGVA